MDGVEDINQMSISRRWSKKVWETKWSCGRSQQRVQLKTAVVRISSWSHNHPYRDKLKTSEGFIKMFLRVHNLSIAKIWMANYWQEHFPSDHNAITQLFSNPTLMKSANQKNLFFKLRQSVCLCDWGLFINGSETVLESINETHMWGIHMQGIMCWWLEDNASWQWSWQKAKVWGPALAAWVENIKSIL